jgi:hypothetical protein
MDHKRSSCYLKAEFRFRPTRKRLSVSLLQDALRIAAHRAQNRNRSGGNSFIEPEKCCARLSPWLGRNQSRASVLPTRRLGQTLFKSTSVSAKPAKLSSPTIFVNPNSTGTSVDFEAERVCLSLVFPLRLRCPKLCPPFFCCLRNLRSRSRRHYPFLPANFTDATPSNRWNLGNRRPSTCLNKWMPVDVYDRICPGLEDVHLFRPDRRSHFYNRRHRFINWSVGVFVLLTGNKRARL